MTYKEKLNNLFHKAYDTIFTLIDFSEDFSKHMHNTQCLKITDEEFMFNLDGGRYLTEITRNELVDNSGYTYSFYELEYENLMLVTDYLIEKYKK